MKPHAIIVDELQVYRGWPASNPQPLGIAQHIAGDDNDILRELLCECCLDNDIVGLMALVISIDIFGLLRTNPPQVRSLWIL